MAQYFNVQKAIQAGYSQGEIDSYMKKNGLAVRPTVAQAQPEIPVPQPTPQPSLSQRIGEGVVGVGKSLIEPFLRTGKNIAGAVTQVPLSVRATELSSKVFDTNLSEEERDKALKDLKRVNQASKLLAPFASDKADVGQQVRDSVNIASYGVPFGKGAGIATKALLPGATVGAMQEVSKEGATPESVVGGAVTGATTGGLMYGGSKLLGAFNKAGKATQQAGEKLIQSQYNLPRSAGIQLKIPETVAKLNEYGISNIDDVALKADKIMRPIEDTIQTTVAKAKPVDLSGVNDVVREIVSDPSIRVGQDEKVLSFVDKMIKKVTSQGKGSQLNFKADPTGTFDMIRTLQKKASDVAKGKLPSSITDEERALKQAYRLIAQELEDRLYADAGAGAITKKTLSPLVGILKTFSPKLAQDAEKVTTVAELRSLMAPFVRGKIASEITEAGANLATDTMGGAVKGVGKLAQNPLNILAVPLGTNTANAGIGSTVSKAGQAMQNIPQSAGGVPTSIASRIPSMIDQPQNAVPQQEQPMPEDKAVAQEQPQPEVQVQESATGYSMKELRTILTNAIKAGDKKAIAKAKDLIDIEKSAQEEAETKTKSSGTATERMNKSRATIGLRALNDAEKMLKKDPSILAKNILPGKPFSRQYENAAVRASEQILRMQTGATVSKEEAKKYAESFMPWFGDDPETIQYKLDQMKLDYQQFID